ncbi:hypothetical protein V6N13_051320 [Hibiscus sabdariffa]|uniref:Uncharacterized protein n=1 Tax=Hibiscus sabdariffa TaxID=183260 RepID=A0ABR2T457_9ROSI
MCRNVGLLMVLQISGSINYGSDENWLRMGTETGSRGRSWKVVNLVGSEILRRKLANDGPLIRFDERPGFLVGDRIWFNNRMGPTWGTQ